MAIYYQYFNAPCTGNYFDYTFDIAPFKDYTASQLEEDFSSNFDPINHRNLAFGFANIPTGYLKVLDRDEDSGNAYIKPFPTGEYYDWINGNEYKPYYNSDSGLESSTFEDMRKTFVLDPDLDEKEVLSEIDFITFFTGVNCRLYDQDNNYVFSYSEEVQGPISIHGNVFEYNQNYSINSLPFNSNLSRGCSNDGHVSGLFFTRHDFEYSTSVRSHTNLDRWTPVDMDDKIWFNESGLFPLHTGLQDNHYPQWIANSSITGEYINDQILYLTSGSRIDTVDLRNFLAEGSTIIPETVYEISQEKSCKMTSALKSDNWSNITAWRGEDLSINLGEVPQLGLVMLVKVDSSSDANTYFNAMGDNNDLLFLGQRGLRYNFEIDFSINSGDYEFDFIFDGTKSSNPLVVSDNDWHILHWVFDENSTMLNSWIDGVRVARDEPVKVGTIPTNFNCNLQNQAFIEVGELLIYPQQRGNGGTELFDIEKNYFIEGYLSHKWNLDLLRPSHPFYHGYPANFKAGMKGGPLEHLYSATISNLTHF